MFTAAQKIKETGATFTPPELAMFLADKLLSYTAKRNNIILDPACGDGALLLAIATVFRGNSQKFELIGYDSNDEYLELAKDRLAENFFNQNVNLSQKDFLEIVDIKPSQISFFDQTENQINEFADIIIANPPYVRTQILGAEHAQNLAQKYNLKGRVDLYYPFLIAMTHALKENGLLGVITSNRYLSTKSGASIRHFLKTHYAILEIIDLGDTKLFDAAVLPAIFIGKKKRNFQNSSPQFIKIYENLNSSNQLAGKSDSIFNLLNSSSDGNYKIKEKQYLKSSGILNFGNKAEDLWTMLSKEEATWVSEIQKNSKYKISDHFKVRVGIKTTADKVFISDNWDALGDKKPEDILLKDLISQENIEQWGLNVEKQQKVLYPYFVQNNQKKVINISDYPKAFQYFKSHEEKLKSRKYLIDSGRKWFEIWVPQNPAFWNLPKVIFPDISPLPRFHFDNSGKIVNGNCYWIVAEHESDIDLLLLIQGVGNSKLMTKYHDLVFNNKLYSGRRRYFSQYIENYPLPNLKAAHSQRIIELVKILNNGVTNLKESIIQELEETVARAFNVDPINLAD